MRRSLVLYMLMVILLMPPIVIWGPRAHAQSSYRLRTSVIGSAGAPESSTAAKSNGTLGQPHCIGISSAGTGICYSGFWKSVWLGPVTEAETPPAYRNELPFPLL